MKNIYVKFLLGCLLCFGGSVMGQYGGIGSFTKINSLAELTDGYYVITNETDGFLMTNGRSGTASAGFFIEAAVTPVSGTITNPSVNNVWKIEINGSGRTIYNEAIVKYAGWGSGNGASIEDVPANTNRWTFSYASAKFTVLNVAQTDRQLSYNSGSPRFAAYANNAQQELQLYKLSSTNYYWNGLTTTGTGPAVGGSSTWVTTATPNWISPTNNASGIPTAWTNSTSNYANFANGSGTVTMGTSITAGGTIISTPYTFAPTASISLTSPVTLTSLLNVSPSSGITFTMNGILGGAGGINQNGAGIILLSGNNTHTGSTTVSSGTLQLGAAGSGSNSPLGTTAAGTSISNGAVLDLNGFTLATAEALTLNGTGISNNGALINSSGTAASYSGTVALASNSSIGTTGNITLSAVVSGSFSLTKVGAGNLTSTAVNTYSGGTILSAGTMTLNPSGNTSQSGTFNFNGGTLTTAAITSGRTVIYGSIDLSENSTLALGSNAHTITFTNPGTFTASRILTITGWAGSIAACATGTAGKVFVGNTASLSAAQLAQIRFTISGINYPATQLASGEIVPTLRLAVTNPGDQTAGLGFSVTVTAVDFDGTARNVNANTGITLNSVTNTIGGTVTGTINSGTSSVVISGVTLTIGNNATITASRTSGNCLLPGTSTTFDVTAAVGHIVTFNGNGSTGGTMSPQNANTSTALTLNAYTRTGYTFAGWNNIALGGGTAYTDGEVYDFSADITLYAQWTPNNNSLTFDANGGTGTMASQTIASNATVSLNLNSYTRVGYTFAGWATTAGGAVVYTDGGSYTMGTGNATIYAKWTPNNYQVIFDANGGTGSMSNQTIAYQTSAALTTNTFTRVGYNFTGWNTLAGGGGTAYANGATYTMNTTANVTLYAQWVAGPCLSENFSASVRPTGWIDGAVSGSVTYPGYADISANTGYVTTIALSNPTQLTFDLARTANATLKNLDVEVSTTSQTAGFAVVASYDHNNTVSNGTTPCTVDLSAYSSSGTVYIRFNKTSGSSSPWRIDNINVYCGTPCASPSTQVSSLSTNTPTPGGFSIAWTAGNGDGTMIVVRPTASANTTPTSGNAYTPNLAWATAGQIDANNRVVFRAAGNAAGPVTGLNAETQYTITAYEYNNTDECYNKTTPPSVTRYTLSTEPTGHSTFSNTVVAYNQIDLTYQSPATFGADGYVILRRADGTNPTTFGVVDGVAPGSWSLPGGTVIVSSNATGTGLSNNGLTGNTNYCYLLIPFNWNGANAETYNYFITPTVPSTCGSTPVAPSANSDIVPSTMVYTSNINYTSYQAAGPLTNTSGSIGVMGITIRDGAGAADSDVLPTVLTGITFSGITGTAMIRTAALFDGNAMVANVPVISTGANTIAFTGFTYSVPDGTTSDLTLRVSFLTTPITDNQQMVFNVTNANVTSASGATSSQFSAFTAVASSTTGDRNRIIVTASKLIYDQQPSNTSNGANMSPAVTVRAVDANDNLDIDYVSSVNVSCSNPLALSGNPVSIAAVAGVATFSTLVHTINGTYTMVGASTGLTSTPASNSYTIATVTFTTGDYRSNPGFPGTVYFNSTNASGGIFPWQTWSGATWVDVVHSSGSPNSPQNLATKPENIYLSGTNVDFAGGATYNNIIVEGGYITCASTSPGLTIATGKKLEVKAGYMYISGVLALSANSSLFVRTNAELELGMLSFNLTRNATSNFVVENEGYVYIDNYLANLWTGNENFAGESFFTIYAWNKDEGLLNSINDINDNSNGSKFGYLEFDISSASLTGNWTYVLPTSGTFNLTHKDFRLTNNSSNNITLNAANVTIGRDFIAGGSGNIQFQTQAGTKTMNVKRHFEKNGTGEFRATSSGTSYVSTINVDSNFTVNAGTFVLDQGITGASTSIVNLKGNLFKASGAYMTNANTNSTTNAFNFNGSTTQLVNLNVMSASDMLRYMFFILNGAYVQLSTQDWKLATNSKITVLSGGTLDFGFNAAGTAPLNVITNGTQTQMLFESQAGSTLKITSPEGITTTAGVGNVQTPVSGRTYSPTGTYHYIGKSNSNTPTHQLTGNALSAMGASNKKVIVELENDVTTLSANAGGNIQFNSGGTLEIKRGILLEASTGTSSFVNGTTDGNLTMSGGRYRINTTGTKPELAGTYGLTGGVVEFGNNGGTAESIRGQTYQNIEVTGNNVGHSIANITLRNNGTFKIMGTGKYTSSDVAIQAVAGTAVASFIMEAGSIMDCKNTIGFYRAPDPVTLAVPTVKKDGVSNDGIDIIRLDPGSTIIYSKFGVSPATGDQPISPIIIDIPAANTVIPYQNLTLAGNGIKSAPAFSTLPIHGNLAKTTTTATFQHNNGTILFNGPAAQGYSSAAPTMDFYNLTVATQAGLNVSSNMSIEKEFLMSDALGNAPKIHLGTDAIVTLKSSLSNTANVARIPADADITYATTGRFEIERYLPTYRTWRFLATPVVNAAGEATIRKSWQEDGAVPAGYGTRITGPEGIGGGFDSVSVGSSLKWFNSTINNYTPVQNTGDLVANNAGYMLFVRGDRSVGANSTPTPTNLRIKGKLRTGDQTFAVPGNGVQSIGNPYASAFRVDTLIERYTATSLSQYYVAWDPSLNSAYGRGAYQYMSKIDHYKALVSGSSLYTIGTEYRMVESGQAFYLANQGATQINVTITESMKESGSRIAAREDTPADRQFIRTKLYASAGEILDGNLVGFDDEFENGYDNNDAVKFANGGENFGMSRFGKTLAVEARGRLQERDTIFYNMNNMREQSYKIELAPENLASTGMEAYFIDRFLNTQTAINLGVTTTLDVSVTSNAASKAANRFLLVFKAMAGPVPVKFVSVAAQRQADRSIAVNWKVANEVNIIRYEVERSANGNTQFTSILTRDAENISSYRKDDLSPLSSDNFYRIKAIGIAGEVTYSDVVKVSPIKTAPSISVYPNPVTDGLIKVRFIDQEKGTYMLELNDAKGSLVYKGSVMVTSDQLIENIQLAAKMPAGNYTLRIVSPGGIASSSLVLLQ